MALKVIHHHYGKATKVKIKVKRSIHRSNDPSVATIKLPINLMINLMIKRARKATTSEQIAEKHGVKKEREPQQDDTRHPQ